MKMKKIVIVTNEYQIPPALLNLRGMIVSTQLGV